MRVILELAAVLALSAGCASHANPAPPVSVTAVTQGRSTGALAFEPAIAANTTSIDVSRDQRGNSAYVGIEDTTTTYFDTYTDDHNNGDQSSTLDRQTYSEKVGDIRR